MIISKIFLQILLHILQHNLIITIIIKIPNPKQKSPIFSHIFFFSNINTEQYQQQQKMTTKQLHAQQSQILQMQHTRIMDKFTSIIEILEQEYQCALENLQQLELYGPVYSVNLGLVHSIFSNLQAISKFIQILRTPYTNSVNNMNNDNKKLSVYLMEQQPITAVSKHAKQLQQTNPQTLIQNSLNSDSITLSKQNISSQNFLSKIQHSCPNILNITLKSDQYDQKSQIQDLDLLHLPTIFTNISTLSLKDSAITDNSLEFIKKQLYNIKEIDISGCYMVTQRGIRLMAECNFVTVKLNYMGGIKDNAILDLIRHANNLNYLQIKNNPNIVQSILFNIYQTYRQCSSSLKWLQVISDHGIDLFINKLSYLTSQNPLQQLTDSQFCTLIGQYPPLYTGIYFQNCVQLTKSSLQLLIQKCPKLRRLALSKYINLTDRLTQDISLMLTQLNFLDLNNCYNITDNALYYIACNLNIQYLGLEKCYSVTDQGLANILRKQLNTISPNKNNNRKKYRSLSKEYNNNNNQKGRNNQRSRNMDKSYITNNNNSYNSNGNGNNKNNTNNNDNETVSNYGYQQKHQNHKTHQNQQQSSMANLQYSQIKLKHLNISHCKKITDQALLLLGNRAQQLNYLNLAYCDHITDISIQTISQYLLNLQYLNLRNIWIDHCQGLTDSSVCMLATRLSKKLKVLEIQWCQVSQNCVRLIAENLSNLQVLNLSYCPSVFGEEIQIIAKNIPKLNTLKLQTCTKISQSAFIKIASLRQIKVICLKQCVQVTDTVIKLLTTNSRNLQHLDISWCTQITDNALFSIAKNCYYLRHLNLNGCIQITDEGIQWLSASVSELQHLNLTLCSKLTDTSILQITSKMKHLKYLSLCQLQNLTDISIATLANLNKLQQLILMGCIGISGGSLVGLMYNLEKLIQFNINQCRSVQGKYLNKICQLMPNLKILQISEIQINNTFLQQLAIHCPKLTSINLCYCNDISDKAVLTMLQKLPRLQRIQIQNTKITEKTQGIIFHVLNARRMDNIVLQ